MSKKKKKINREELYALAKEAKVGSTIKCPGCGKEHIKKFYNTTFCTRKCKDAYWNKVDPNKRCRKNDYYYSKILNCMSAVNESSSPKSVLYNMDYRSYKDFCKENNLNEKSELSERKYKKEVILENKIKSHGYESYDQYKQSILDQSLGDDECESFGCTLSICDCCGLRADICQCGEY